MYNAINELGKKKLRAQAVLISFFQHYWDIDKRDIVCFFTDFHERCVFQKSLLPKVVGTSETMKFKHIIRVGNVSVYRIPAKVLTSRLNKVDRKAVSPNQYAFTHHCKILDANLTANYLINASTRISSLIN